MMFRAEHFSIEPVADRVWAAVAAGSASAQGNAGIVGLPEYTVVFDTFLTPQAAHELRSAARTLTGRDATLVVNSHWHFDHCGGNEVFADCELLGTPLTRSTFAERASAFLQTVNDAGTARVISDLRWRLQSEPDPTVRADLDAEAAMRQELYDLRAELRLRAPNLEFTGRRELTSRWRAWLLEGAGHTRSDTVLFLPDLGVLFAGDLVTSRTHPDLRDGVLDRWLDCLDRLGSLGARRVVPGHGPVAGPEILDETANYLRRIRELAGAPEKPPLPEQWREWRSRAHFDPNLAVAHRSLVAG